jgi:hypothetical protein
VYQYGSTFKLRDPSFRSWKYDASCVANSHGTGAFGPCVTLTNGTEIEFRSMSDYNVPGSAAYSTLRQYYPIAFGQSRFVKHQGGFLWYLPFDSATSAQFSLRFLLQADGSFALQTYDGLYVGYDASVDQLCAVAQYSERYKTWTIETIASLPSGTPVVGMAFDMYSGYFAGDTAFAEGRDGLQPRKVTSSLQSLAVGTNGYLV